LKSVTNFVTIQSTKGLVVFVVLWIIFSLVVLQVLIMAGAVVWVFTRNVTMVTITALGMCFTYTKNLIRKIG
jgi:hypothetical protein